MSAVLLLVATVLALVALLGGPRRALAVLISTAVLIPSTLLVPGSPTAVLTVARLIEGAALVGLVLSGRRDPGRGPMPRGPLVVVVLCAYLGVCAVTGIGLADPSVDPVAAAYSWVVQAEQLGVLLLALALARRVPSGVVLRQLAVVTALAVAVYLLESVTGASFARLLFRGRPDQLGSVPASVLERRDGHLRVRGAADFALEGGWVLVALLPVLCVLVATALRTGRRRSAVVPAGLVLVTTYAIYLTRSRSPFVAALLVVTLLLLVLSPRRPATVLPGAALLLLATSFAAPALAAGFSRTADAGSAQVRLERLPDVLALAAPHPLRGFGFTGIGQLGLAGVDSSFVQVYVETGAVAVALLILALVVVTASVLSGLRTGLSEDPDDRMLVLATGVALATLVASAVTFDTFTAGSYRLFWLVGGLGLAAAERSGAVPRRRSARVLLSPIRWGAVVLAVTAGVVVRLSIPAHAATEVVFSTLALPTETLDDPAGLGQVLVRTFCGLADDAARSEDVRVTVCIEKGPPGWGVLRVEADDPLSTTRGARAVVAGAARSPALRFVRAAPTVQGPAVGIASVADVAPEVAGLLALSGLLLLPARRRPDATDDLP